MRGSVHAARPAALSNFDAATGGFFLDSRKVLRLEVVVLHCSLVIFLGMCEGAVLYVFVWLLEAQASGDTANVE